MLVFRVLWKVFVWYWVLVVIVLTVHFGLKALAWHVVENGVR